MLIAPVRRFALSSRSGIADLWRRLAALESASALLQSVVKRIEAALPAPAPDKTEKARVTATGLRSLRKRLGLSGDELAKLVGVTGQAVYNWEKGAGPVKLRATTRAAVLKIRGIGAREARKRLAEMPVPKKAAKRRKTARRK